LHQTPKKFSADKLLEGLDMDEKFFFTNAVPKKYVLASLDICDRQPFSFIEFGKKWAEKPTSIFLHGGYGSGKTFYAFALIREMFRKCKNPPWPRYFSSTELDAKGLESYKLEGGEKYFYEFIKEIDLLFIDDLGRETKSERIKKQYFQIFDTRYKHDLPTIVTSNYTLDQLGDFLDGSIASRMQEWQVIEFKNQDLRKLI
jgi:DNA replication protein DnaC